MLGDIAAKLFSELDSLGFPGIVILALIVALTHLWRELRTERKRCETLTDRLDTMSRETIIMVERIIGSK